VNIASGPDAFVAACRQALAEGGARTEARMTEARRHTWDSRIDSLLDGLHAAGLDR
jgi:hypothetical protein